MIEKILQDSNTKCPAMQKSDEVRADKVTHTCNSNTQKAETERTL